MKQLILLALIGLSLAITDNQIKQGDIFTKDVNDDLQQSKLGRAILKLAELQSKSQQVDFSRLFNALDELEASLQESRSQEQSQFQQDYTQYLSDVQFYQNQLTQFTNEVAQHDVDLAELNDSLTSQEARLSAKRDELTQVKRLSTSLASLMGDSERVFQSQQSDYADAIEVLDQTIALIEQVRNGAFIQEDELRNNNILLQQKISNVKSQRILYQPLIEALSQLSQNKFADQQLVSQVLGLMRELRTQLSNSRLSLVNAYQAEKDRNNVINQEYSTLVNNLSTVVIPEVQQNIEVKQGEIQTKRTLLNDATENLRVAQQNFDATEAAWVQRQNSNKQLVDEYNNELLIINQARTALERGGIRRQN